MLKSLACFGGGAVSDGEGAQRAAEGALRAAATRGDAEGVKAALAKGADVDCRSESFPDTPLFNAVQHASLEAAEALLKAGASVHARNSHGALPGARSRGADHGGRVQQPVGRRKHKPPHALSRSHVARAQRVRCPPCRVRSRATALASRVATRVARYCSARACAKALRLRCAATATNALSQAKRRCC